MVLAGNIGSLIDFFSFTAWIFYGGSMLAVLVQRYTRPDVPRPYKVCTEFIKYAEIWKLICPIVSSTGSNSDPDSGAPDFNLFGCCSNY